MTGGIASGKSTILRWIAEDGFSVSSSDQVARALMADLAVRQSVSDVARLPVDFSSDSLRRALLSDAAVRRAVNRIMHPLIGRINEESDAQFCESPLLVEACLYDAYDEVWLVECGEEEQRRRLAARYPNEPDLIDRILSTQLKTVVKRAFADRVIRTNEPEGNVRLALASILEESKLEFVCSHW